MSSCTEHTVGRRHSAPWDYLQPLSFRISLRPLKPWNITYFIWWAFHVKEHWSWKDCIADPQNSVSWASMFPRPHGTPSTQPVVLRVTASSYSCQTSTGGTAAKRNASDYHNGGGGKEVKKASKQNLEINLDSSQNKSIKSLWHSIVTLLVMLWQRTRNCLWGIMCDRKKKKMANDFCNCKKIQFFWLIFDWAYSMGIYCIFHILSSRSIFCTQGNIF